MGWTASHKPKGQSLAEYFVEHGVLRWTSETATYRVLATSFKMPAFYAAIERLTPEDREVFAMIILVKQFKEDQYGHNICWKDMDESMGPYEDNCPEHILDLLTPTWVEHANEWRERCRAKHAARRARPKIVVGTKLLYGGTTYEVTKCLGNRGYQVDGYMRMRRSQADQSIILGGQ